MKRCLGLPLLALVFIFFAAKGLAQEIKLRLQLAQTVYVVGESTLVQVTAQNLMRDTIRLSAAGPSKLFFEIAPSTAVFDELHPTSERQIQGAYVIKTGESVKLQSELDKCFPLLKPGRYLVRAILFHKGIRYQSQKKSFEIVPGIDQGKGLQMFVKPATLKRNFQLVYWHRNQMDRLFLKTRDEPSGQVWDSVDLGNFMRTAGAPKLDIAPDGVVTVTHRSGQDGYIRTVLWSLPESLEVVERNHLVDPDVAASRRAKGLYGEMSGDKKEEEKPWWKFWQR